MPKTIEAINPEYLIDEDGHKKAVVIKFADYENLLEFIEDLEDTNELLKSEREATTFIPYDEFRKKWLKP